MKRLPAAALVFAIGFGLGPAPAKAQFDRSIQVELWNLRAEIARTLRLDLQRVPLTIQLPITIAAGLCGTSVDALSAQARQGIRTCAATDTARTAQVVSTTVR